MIKRKIFIATALLASMCMVGGCATSKSGEKAAEATVVLQAESEVAAINMVYGGAGSGKMVMTSSSSPGAVSYTHLCRAFGVQVDGILIVVQCLLPVALFPIGISPQVVSFGLFICPFFLFFTVKMLIVFK